MNCEFKKKRRLYVLTGLASIFLITIYVLNPFCKVDYGFSHNNSRIINGIPKIEKYFYKLYPKQKKCESQSWRARNDNYVHYYKDVIIREGIVLEIDYFREPKQKDSVLLVKSDYILPPLFILKVGNVNVDTLSKMEFNLHLNRWSGNPL